MRTEIFSVLLVTLWAATTPGSAYREERVPVVDKIAGPTAAFATNLMKHMTEQPASENIIMSPLSVSTLLAMVQQGAKENSATQLESVLHLNSKDAKNGYQSLLTKIKARQSNTVLRFGNSMFLNQNFDVLPEFRESMSRDFLATVDKLEFHRPEVAAQKINTWVSNATRGNINDIIKPEAITGRTEMILANAIYFKGQWTFPFAVSDTVSAPFYKDGNQPPITVNMMSLNQDLRAAEEKNNLKAKWVELPYELYEYSLIVVLPDDNIDALIKRMGAAHIKYLATTTSVRDVTLKMPRFKLETSVSLVPVLNSMGLQDIFSQNSNLEGISLTKRPLVVSDVLHKARIDVNENGSEASASSAIFVNTLSLTPNYDDLEIILDRPFLAIILDKTSQLPIFMAKVTSPSSM